MGEKLKKGIEQKQASRVMEEFYKKRLRDPHGHLVTSPEVAKAISYSEGKAAGSRGVSKRTFKGRTRIRPKLKGD